MRKPLLITLAVVAALVATAAFAAGRPAAVEGPGLVAAGSFHRLGWPTSGGVTLVRRADGKLEVRMRDLRTKAAPDLFVYLFDDGRNRTSIEQGTNLGRLRSVAGDQRYVVPISFEAGGIATVVIWCAACETESGAAVLRPV